MYKKGLLVALITLAVDQLNKWHLIKVFNIGEKSPLEVTPFFNLVMVWNRGVSFGMFNDSAYSVHIFTFTSILIVCFLGYWLKKTEDKLTSIAIGFIIGGAIGNVIDRIYHGAVADFFDFHVNGYHWPAFNIADSAIFIGALFLCIDSFFCGNKLPKEDVGSK